MYVIQYEQMPVDSIEFDALCPCGALAQWKASAATSPTCVSTQISYVIDCPQCGQIDEEAA